MMLRHVWIFVVAFAVAGGTFSAALLFPQALAIFSVDGQSKAVPAAKTQSGVGTNATTSSNRRNVGINILIRRTLLTLNDANLSGNYSILRHLAAPGFQRANSSAKIARAFTNLRNTRIDMASVVHYTPKLVREPQLNESGQLRLTGYVPTRPRQIKFDMLFEKHDKRWLLFGLSVNAVAPKTAAVAR